MSKLILTDCRLFVGGADLSGQSNSLEITDEFEDKDVTNWRSGGAHELLAGLEQPKLTAEGQWEAGDPSKIDDAMWASRRTVEAWTASPSATSDTTVGGLAYVVAGLRTSAALLGQVGDVAPWKASASGSGPMGRGVFLHPSGTARTATGNGTAVQLGAVPDGRQLRVNLHILSVAGTTPLITVKLDSDSGSGFSSPIERAAFAQKGVTGDQSIVVDGPITDDWWRINWTVSGAGPSFLFLVAAGIS